ncbi:MAG: murein biosynthesis integral membrane protein MurJ [Ignavibacteriaceae bacterium]
MIQFDAKPYAATRSVAILTVLSVLSPVSGVLLEMVLAWRFGASSVVDAFRIASLVVVLGNQLFFGYLLPHVVVPLFSEYRAKGLEYEGLRLTFSLALILSLVSLIFIYWVWFDPEALVGLLGPGLAAPGREAASLLVRCYSLVFLLMLWSGVVSGILYVYRVFWLSAVAQLLPNLFVVMSIFIASRELGVGALALGILLGYTAMLGLFIHTLIHISRVSSIRLSACLKLGPRDGLQKALYLSVPLVLAIFIGQWGSIIINRALSGMPPGTLAEFGYAWKLLALISLLPAGLATVIFPAFSDAHANNNPSEFSRLVTRAFRMTLLLTLPLAAALFVERIPLVSLIFRRGGMSMTAVAETGQLFGILLVGAPAGALSAALYKVAFSKQDTKSPTIVALISALAITGLVPHAAETGGANGVAWAFSAITWGSTLIMLGYQIFRYRIMPVWEVLRYFGLLIALCIGVALPVMGIRALFELNAPMMLGFALLEMTLAGLIFIIVGYVLSRLLGIHESSEIWRYIKWQLQQMPFIKKVLSIN